MNKVQLIVESDLSQVDNAFTKNQKVINDTNEEAQQFGRTVKQSANIATKELNQFEKEAKQGTREINALSKAAASVGRDGAKGVQQLSTATKKYTADAKAANKETSALKEGTSSMADAIAGAFSVAAVGSFIGKIVSTRAEFQKFEAVLTNTLGSKSLAQNALMMIQDVASKTPFSVQELTASFVKLANSGFKPTAKEITKLGDLAASQGKSFDQLTEGIIDAQTGEFERLKEFGIKASKEGDNVRFSFKGVQTQVKNNSEAIQGYILSLGELEGVSGGMAAISDTLGGKISNLGDNFDAFFNNLGKNSEGVFGSVIDGFNKMIGSANDAQTILNQIGGNLKGTTGEISIFDEFTGKGTAAVLSLQVTLNELNKFGSEATKVKDLVPAYVSLNRVLAAINQNYKDGKIDVETFNRQVILTVQAQKSLDDKRKELIGDKNKSADKLKAEAEAKAAKEAAKEADKAAKEAERKAKADAKAAKDKKIQDEDKLFHEIFDQQSKNQDVILSQEKDAKDKRLKQEKEDADELFDQLSKNQDEETRIQLEGLKKRQKDREDAEKKVEEQRKLFLQELERAGEAIINLAQQQVNQALEANQREIDSSKEKQDQLLQEKDALLGKLNEEQQKKDEGFANDTDRTLAEIAAKDAQIADEKKREQEIIEERKKTQKLKLALDTALQVSNLLTAGSTLFAQGALTGPVGIAAAITAIASMAAAFFAFKEQLKAINEGGGEGFAEGGYTGDGGKYDRAGDVHRGEYVITKEKTAKNRALLEGLHTDNPTLIREGVFELLRNTGVSLPASDNISNKRALINEASYASSKTDRDEIKKITAELVEIKAKFDDMIKAQDKDTYNLPDGSLVKKKGSHTTRIRKSGE